MEPNLGRQAVTAAVAGLAVSPDNVLGIHNAIKAEAKELGDLFAAHAADLHLEPLGSDPVSSYATPIFNAKLDTFKELCSGYIDALRELADQLARTARGYGYTEQQIADSFQAHLGEKLAPPVSGSR